MPARDPALRRLCAGTILCAQRDAEGRPEAPRAPAVAWLASTRAELFFDAVDIAQSRWLMASPWRQWAREVLASEDPEGKHRFYLELIDEALAYLDDLESRRVTS